MKKFALIALTAAALALAAVLLMRMAPRREDPLRGAETARVVRHDLERAVTATGVIKPRVGAEVRVGSRASGVVRRLLVRIGDTVKKGEILAELETGELDARRAQTTAAVASARADLDYAEADLQRKRELAALQLLPRSELDLAERASAVASERLREAAANLDLAATQLGYARIVSPIAGVVASISTQEGRRWPRASLRPLSPPSSISTAWKSGPTWTRPTSAASASGSRRASPSTPTPRFPASPCEKRSALVVLVVAAPPDARLVAAPGGAVEPLVHAPEGVHSARVGGIGYGR